MKILVRSLERTVTEEESLKLFQEYGTVECVRWCWMQQQENLKVLHLWKCHMHVKQLKPLKRLNTLRTAWTWNTCQSSRR